MQMSLAVKGMVTGCSCGGGGSVGESEGEGEEERAAEGEGGEGERERGQRRGMTREEEARRRGKAGATHVGEAAGRRRVSVRPGKRRTEGDAP